MAKNIEFPLRQRGVEKEERGAKVKRAAETLGLGALLDRKPAQLSGGQRQRVALARAIVREPLVFLMDEPLSNLDAALRVQTRADIVELQSRLETTTLYVTHDQVEAMTMGHRIAVMSEGKLQQVAAPEDLYDRPANTFVARFLGSPGMNLIAGMLVESGAATRRHRRPARCCVAFPGASVPLPDAVGDAVRGAGPEVVLGLRPEALRLEPGRAHRGHRGHRRAARGRDPCDLQHRDGARIIVRQAAAAARPATRCASQWTPTVAFHLFDADRRPAGRSVVTVAEAGSGGVTRRGGAAAW